MVLFVAVGMTCPAHLPIGWEYYQSRTPRPHASRRAGRMGVMAEKIIAAAVLGLLLGCSESGTGRPLPAQFGKEAWTVIRSLEDCELQVGGSRFYVSNLKEGHPWAKSSFWFVYELGTDSPRLFPVVTEGDVADLYRRVTGKEHPTLKGELSEEYKAFRGGKGR